MANQLLTPCPEHLLLEEAYSCTFMEDYTSQLPTTGLILNSNAVNKSLRNAMQMADGTTKAVEVVWNQEFCGTPEDGCLTDVCNADPMDLVQAKTTISYDPCDDDNSGHMSFKVKYDEFREFNELMSRGSVGVRQLLSASSAGSNDSIQFRLYSAIKKLELQAEDKLSAKLVDLIIDATGGFSKYERDNAAALGLTFATSTFGKAKEVKTFGAVETANATNFNDALSEIQESAFQARFCSSPIVVGGKSMQQYMSRLESGCCASNGFDIADYASRFSASFLRNNSIEKLIGNDHFLSIELGAIQYLNKLQYQGKWGWSMPTSYRGTITSPWTGRVFDMTWRFEECTGDVIYTLAYNETLLDIPQHFCAGDHREGVNGLQLFKIKNS
jgi:hypothetical protein